VLVADVILMVVVRRVPWREVPIPVALGVAAIGFVAAFVVPSTATDGLASVEHPAVTAVVVGVAAGLANVINNLPALLVGLEGADQTSTGFWAWLLGVNTGAALVPIGALANLLWWRIAVAEGVRLDLRRYLRVTVPVTLAALAASAATLALLQR
jgi:arsenical pump membrane protein